MKRYLLFAGRTYYPEGGWDDLVGSFDSVEEAQEHRRRENRRARRRGVSPVYQWWQVVDTTTWEVVAR